jgi:hypothetical protein
VSGPHLKVAQLVSRSHQKGGSLMVHTNFPRSGHVGGHLRDAFVEWVEQALDTEVDDPWPEAEIDGRLRRATWLFGQLWNCTDLMPRSTCEDVDMLLAHPEHAVVCTYGQAVRRLKAMIEEDE